MATHWKAFAVCVVFNIALAVIAGIAKRPSQDKSMIAIVVSTMLSAFVLAVLLFYIAQYEKQRDIIEQGGYPEECEITVYDANGYAIFERRGNYSIVLEERK